MSNTSKVLLGLIAGAAIGGALGILLAPDKGSETRRRIVESGSDLGDSIAGFGEKVRDKFNDVVENMKGGFNSTKNSTMS